MQISLPPFLEAFPESLIYATPAASQRSSQGTLHPNPFHSHLTASSIPQRQPVDQCQRPRPSHDHLTAARSASPLTPSPPSTPALSVASSVHNSSRSPTPPYQMSQLGRPVLRCTEAGCNRVYSCVGNLNRHRKVAHGLKGR